MTTPHGQIPRAKTSPNGRRPAGRRPGTSGPRPKVPTLEVPTLEVPTPEVPRPEHEDAMESAAHLAGGAEAALGPGPLTGFGLRQAAGVLRFAGREAVRQPQTLMRGASGIGRELLRAGLGGTSRTSWLGAIRLAGKTSRSAGGPRPLPA